MKQKHNVSTIAILAAVVSLSLAMGVSSVYAQQYQSGSNPPTSNTPSSTNMTSAINMSNASTGGNMTSAGNMSNASAPTMTNSS